MDWSITIQQGPSSGHAKFKPDPVEANNNDVISWANETNENHQIAIDGVTFTDVIKPFESSTPAYVAQNDGDDPITVSYKCVVPGHSETGTINIAPVLLLCAMLLGIFAPRAMAQSSTSAIDCSPIIGKELENPKEFMTRDTTKQISKGTMVSAAANEIIGFVQGGRQSGSLLKDGKPDPSKILCYAQWMRSYSPNSPAGSQSSDAPAIKPFPGPLIKARVGDLVELTFMNLIDPLRFPRSPADPSKEQPKCEEFTAVKNGKTVVVYPTTDKYPDCFNESVFTNVHFHGTHTNPQSTGDNVFLEFAPMPRAATTARTPMPDPNQNQAFADLFARCEQQLPTPTVPKLWPRLWNGTPTEPGPPDSFKKWMTDTVSASGPNWYQQNLNAIANGAWPQYYIGAYPYCYRLPDYTKATWTPLYPPTSPAASDESAHAHGAGSAEADESQNPQRALAMGQAPGTHWYHAHKHGSTTINVTNGMTGVFLIEGKYDDQIKASLGGNPATKVMVINQLGGTPFLARGAGGSDPYFSVNGQLQPVITMAPGEVQWWRIADTSARAGVYFLSPSSTCQPTDKALTWKQIAQDGVQFNNTNYTAPWNNCSAFFLASGNRGDLLVRAPNSTGDYPVLVLNSVDATDRLPCADQKRIIPALQNCTEPTPLTLATVHVTGTAKNQNFPASAPDFPPFLQTIAPSEVQATRTMVFQSQNNGGGPSNPAIHTIDGKLFDGEVGAAIVLNQTEEWKIVNRTFPNANGGGMISHPFHIHINPFQIVEFFDPNAQTTINGKLASVYVTSNPVAGKQCLIDPADPTTWHPCAAVPPPSTVWWDVFPMPSGNVFNGVQIPGYFKMRSRFVDFPGYYVLHCHILAHEDRGMMTVVYVTPLQPPFSHH